MSRRRIEPKEHQFILNNSKEWKFYSKWQSLLLNLLDNIDNEFPAISSTVSIPPDIEKDIYRFILLGLYTIIPYEMGVLSSLQREREFLKRFKKYKAELIRSMKNTKEIAGQFLRYSHGRFNPSYLGQTDRRMITNLHQYAQEAESTFEKKFLCDNDRFLKFDFRAVNPLLDRKLNGENSFRNFVIKYIFTLLQFLGKLFKSNYQKHRYIYRILCNLSQKDKNFDLTKGLAEGKVRNFERSKPLQEMQSPNIFRALLFYSSGIADLDDLHKMLKSCPYYGERSTERALRVYSHLQSWEKLNISFRFFNLGTSKQF